MKYHPSAAVHPHTSDVRPPNAHPLTFNRYVQDQREPLIVHAIPKNDPAGHIEQTFVVNPTEAGGTMVACPCWCVTEWYAVRSSRDAEDFGPRMDEALLDHYRRQQTGLDDGAIRLICVHRPPIMRHVVPSHFQILPE